MSEFFEVFLSFFFAYVGIMKIVEHSSFKLSLKQSPLLSDWNIYIILFALPVLEIVISLLLFSSKYILLATKIMVITMILFTIYIFLLLNHPNTPCACGGILNYLSYTEHISLNIAIIAWVFLF